MMQQDPTLSDSRVRLLDTAQQLFHQRGYKSVTMQQIARELGIRQASLYYHMPDGKEQLFVEVLARSFEQHREGLQAALKTAGPSLEAKLRAAAMWFASQPPMSLLGMMHADMPALSEENTRWLEEQAFRCLFDPIATAFRTAVASGEIRPLQPDLLAGSFLALIDGIAYASAHQAGSPPRRAMNDVIVSMILDGLRPRPETNGVTTDAISTN